MTDPGLCLAAGLEGIEEHALLLADAGLLQRGGKGEAGELACTRFR